MYALSILHEMKWEICRHAYNDICMDVLSSPLLEGGLDLEAHDFNF